MGDVPYLVSRKGPESLDQKEKDRPHRLRRSKRVAASPIPASCPPASATRARCLAAIITKPGVSRAPYAESLKDTNLVSQGRPIG